MRVTSSQAVEDYLKAIYEIAGSDGRAATTVIAERLGVRPASVTGMIQKLASADPPMVSYHKRHGTALTPAGRAVALEMIRHHRLLELYLQERLGFSWDEVHGEADQLEHFISEDLEEHLARDLGDPSYDPHGEPIPTREFALPQSSPLRLCDLEPGLSAVVQRISGVDAEGDLLRYLASIGLAPEARVEVVARSPYDDNLTLKITGQDTLVTVGPRITEKVYVEP